MWTALRRFWQMFSIGFVAAFVVYLFVRWDADAVLLGVLISAVAGVLFSLGVFFLQRRFPEPETR